VETVQKPKVAITPIADYLEEGLLALVPYYKNGSKTVVITMKGSYPDKRAVSWLLKTIAIHYQRDIDLIRKHYSKLLNLRSNISLAFTQHLVLMPVKLRKAARPGENTIGYILASEIKAVTDLPMPITRNETTPWRSAIIFKNGRQLLTLNSASKLHEKMDQSKEVLEDYQQLYGTTTEKCPFSREALLAQMQSRNCVVLETLIKKLGLETDAKDLCAADLTPSISSRFSPEIFRRKPGINDQIIKE